MSKTRIHELAKQLNAGNKELIGKLNEMGLSVTNHMASLEDDMIVKVTDLYKKKENAGPAKPE